MTRFAILALTLVLLSGGCSGSKSRQSASTSSTASTPKNNASAPQLTDLRDIGELRSLFNTRSGEPRLIVLVSPT